MLKDPYDEKSFLEWLDQDLDVFVWDSDPSYFGNDGYLFLFRQGLVFLAFRDGKKDRGARLGRFLHNAKTDATIIGLLPLTKEKRNHENRVALETQIYTRLHDLWEETPVVPGDEDRTDEDDAPDQAVDWNNWLHKRWRENHLLKAFDELPPGFFNDLIRDGFVVKTESGFALTDEGRHRIRYHY
jgi:hypothetical protein